MMIILYTLVAQNAAFGDSISAQRYELDDTSIVAKKADFINFIGMEFVTIPEGSFHMGACTQWSSKIDNPDNVNLANYILACSAGSAIDYMAKVHEAPQHLVSLDYDFQLGMHEVTIQQYARFFKDYKHFDTENFRHTNSIFQQGDSHPVMHVGYNDALKFAQWLNLRKPKSDEGFYRLPSEAEWEYAARAGTLSRFWWGDEINCSYADYNYTICNSMGPSPVGSYAPNPWQLYDMNGNVSEWVSDCWNSNYLSAPTNGSVFQRDGCVMFVHRGGSWLMPKDFLRNSDRKLSVEGFRSDVTGLRIVRELP